MMKLSFCAIAKNEEISLPRCLSSVKDVVDEIIVLDTGSTDKTVEVAKEWGAKVYYYEWNDDFSKARNEALKYVSGDWILVLDADEVLTPEIVPMMKQEMERKENLVINLIRQEIGASQSPYSLVSRLFRKHSEVYFTRPYHGMVDDSVVELLKKDARWRIVSLPDIGILHYGYQAEAIASQNKYNRAQQAMEGFFAKHPDDPYVCSKLGALYVQTNQISKGIELLKQGLNSKKTEPPVLYELHYHLGNAYTRTQEIQLAAKHYEIAIQQPILQQLKLGAYNNLGNLLKAVGDLKTAQIAYETTLKIDPNFASGHYNLGMTLKALGFFEKAIASYQQAIHLNPNYAEAYQNLGVVLLKLGKLPESLAAFGSAIALHDQHNPTEAQRLRQGLLEMGLQV